MSNGNSTVHHGEPTGTLQHSTPASSISTGIIQQQYSKQQERYGNHTAAIQQITGALRESAETIRFCAYMRGKRRNEYRQCLCDAGASHDFIPTETV